MTHPVERRNAVSNMRNLVEDIAVLVSKSKGNNVLVYRDLLKRLIMTLRHYPTEMDLTETAKKCPELWK